MRIETSLEKGTKGNQSSEIAPVWDERSLAREKNILGGI